MLVYDAGRKTRAKSLVFLLYIHCEKKPQKTPTIKLTFLSSNVLLLLFCFSFTGGGGGLIQDWTSFGPRLKRSSSDLELRGKVLCSSVKTRRGRRSGFEEEAEDDDKFMICEH